MATGTSAATAAQKWSSRASIAGPDYVSGATAAAATQTANTVAQASSWLQGVNQAGTKSFTDGVTAAGQAGKYAARINAVGSSRYTQGVGAATQTFQTQIGKVLTVENSVQLSPKGPKGSAANQLRSTEMQTALRQAKVNGQFK